MKILLLASISLLPLAAQLRVTAVDPASGAEVPVSGAFFSIGSPGPSDEIRTRFRIYNTTNAPLVVQRVRLAGDGFSMVEPSPTTLASGRSLDVLAIFRAARSGGYSANFTADSFSVLLTANVLAGPTVTLVRGGSPISAGTILDAGASQTDQSAALGVWLENRESGGAQLSVRNLTISGQGFSLAGAPSVAPIPSGGATRIEVVFAPSANGRFTGALTIDGRVFPLAGIGADPPLSRPSIVIDGVAASGQSSKLSVQLAAPSPRDATGTLKMEFRPLITGAGDDSAIRFLSSNGRNLSVQVRKGEAKAWFGNTQDAPFQSGSTAGTIVWTLEIGGFTEVRTMDLLPAPITLDQALAVRRTQDLDVTLAGFDNTRSTEQVLFTFFDTGGRAVSPGTIRTDVRQDFARFFASSSTGGVFTMRASFPVQGPVAQIAAVEVEIVNSAGSARTQRLSIAGN